MTKRHVVFALLALVALARPTSAEAGQGAIASGVVAATSIESRTEPSIAGAFAYRLNRFVGFGVEVTFVPELKPDVAALGQSTLSTSGGSAVVVTSISVPTSAVSGTDGRGTVFTTNVRFELPSTTARVIPYVIGGGGIANVKETFSITLPVPGIPPGIPVVIPPQLVTQSSTDLALTLGGGVSVLVAAHVSIDVDLRYLRLVANRDLNVGRFGGGLSYRF